jgi:hypothetical protein
MRSYTPCPSTPACSLHPYPSKRRGSRASHLSQTRRSSLPATPNHLYPCHPAFPSAGVEDSLTRPAGRQLTRRSPSLSACVFISHAAGHQDITITCHRIVPPTAAVAPAIKCHRHCCRRHSLAASTATNVKTLTVISSLESNILPSPNATHSPRDTSTSTRTAIGYLTACKRTRKAVKR